MALTSSLTKKKKTTSEYTIPNPQSPKLKMPGGPYSYLRTTTNTNGGIIPINEHTYSTPVGGSSGSGSGSGSAPNYADYSSNMNRPDYTDPSSIEKPQYQGATDTNINVDRSESNKWRSKLESLYDSITNRGAFKYDQASDPLYQQYAEMYARNAKLAMQDTMGQAAALTGGYGSSYAETAGQSMYNQQMGQLNEKALQLYDMARKVYNDETDRLYNNYNMANTAYGNAYNAEQNEIANRQWQINMLENQRQYNNQLLYQDYQNAREDAMYANDYNYNLWRDNVSDAQWKYNADVDAYRDARDYNYKLSRDAVEDQRYSNEWNYKTSQDDYQRYLDERNWQYQLNRDSIEDQRYDNEWNYQKYLDDRNYNYQLDRDRVSDERYNNEWQYQLDRDKVSDERYNNEWEYQKYLDDRNYKYQRERDRASDAQWQKSFDESKRQYDKNFQESMRQYDQNYNEEMRQFDTKYDYETLKNQYSVMEGNTPNAQYFIDNGGNKFGNKNGNEIHSKEEYQDMIKHGKKSLVVTTEDNNGNRTNEYFNAKKYGSDEAAYEAYVNKWLNETKGLSEKEKDYLLWYYTH